MVEEVDDAAPPEGPNMRREEGEGAIRLAAQQTAGELQRVAIARAHKALELLGGSEEGGSESFTSRPTQSQPPRSSRTRSTEGRVSG